MRLPSLFDCPTTGLPGLRFVALAALLAALPLLVGCGRHSTTEAAGTAPVSSLAGDEESTRRPNPAHNVAPNALSDSGKAADGHVVPTLVDGKPTVNLPTAPNPAAHGDPKSASAAPAGDAEYRKLIVGKWRQSNVEKRTITVKADGTATIVAELSDVRQYIVGKLLRFDLEWTIEDGTLTFVTLGGDPPDSIKYINAIYGKSRAYRIREFSRERMLPEKVATGEIEPEWTRLADDSAAR